MAVIATTLAAAALVAFPPQERPPVRAVIQTDLGPVTLSLDVQNAPVSTCNFLRYARAGQYRDARFFRTVVRATNANRHPIDVIQAETTAGSDDPGLGPIPLERTRDTGLSHFAGTISMARNGPDTATSSFFIVTEDTPALDFGGGRNPDGQGFAAFGQVVEGLDLVRTIQRRPAVDEQLVTPVTITDIVPGSPVPDICAAIFPDAP